MTLLPFLSTSAPAGIISTKFLFTIVLALIAGLVLGSGGGGSFRNFTTTGGLFNDPGGHRWGRGGGLDLNFKDSMDNFVINGGRQFLKHIVGLIFVFHQRVPLTITTQPDSLPQV